MGIFIVNSTETKSLALDTTILGLGEEIDTSPYRYEVVRMLFRGQSIVDIALMLTETFGFDTSPQELYAFQGKYYEQYEAQIARIVQLTNLEDEEVTKQSKQFNLLAQLTSLLNESTERIIRIKDLPDTKQSAQMEQALVKLYNLKQNLAERIGEILEDTGMEHKLRHLLEEVAKLVVQYFVPHIPEDLRGQPIAQFAREMDRLVKLVIKSEEK